MVWGVTANEDRVHENVLELESGVMVAQLCEHTNVKNCTLGNDKFYAM